MISLDEIKLYIQVDADEEDTLIKQFSDEAEIYIDSCCGEGYKQDTKKIKLANLLIKKIVKDMYENRGFRVQELKTGFDSISETILDILSNSGDSNET